MSTKINAEIYGNLPYGIIRLSKKGFSTVVYRVPRSQLDYFYGSIEESHNYGTYILFNKVTRQAYIGRTEDLQKRSKQHDTKKPFWTEMFAITTKNKNEFELTDVAFLEHIFYEMAKEAKSYKIENSTEPSDGNAIDNMPEILEFTRNCLNILGYDLFEKSQDLTEYTPLEEIKKATKTNLHISDSDKELLVDSINLENKDFAATIMQIVSKYQLLADEDIQILTDQKYCKSYFKSDYPFLKEVDVSKNIREQVLDKKGKTRFYQTTFSILSKNYTMTSQLYGLNNKKHGDNRTPFYNWLLSKIGIITASER